MLPSEWRKRFWLYLFIKIMNEATPRDESRGFSPLALLAPTLGRTRMCQTTPPLRGLKSSPLQAAIHQRTKVRRFLAVVITVSIWPIFSLFTIQSTTLHTERGGFEPPVRLPPQRFSRPPPSTAQPPLHSRQMTTCYYTWMIFPWSSQRTANFLSDYFCLRHCVCV